MLNKVVILNLAFLLTHQVDGAYWHEWEIFRLSGSIQLNNFINVLTCVGLLSLLIPVVQRKASGITCSRVIAVVSALVLPTHVGFAVPSELRSALSAIDGKTAPRCWQPRSQSRDLVKCLVNTTQLRKIALTACLLH